MDDEKYFLETYKETALMIRDEVARFASSSLGTFPQDDILRLETVRFVVDGGKRFRPSLAYLIARYYGVEELQSCLSLEYFHKYILAQDDIIDRDDTRYHSLTVHKKLEEVFPLESVSSSDRSSSKTSPTEKNGFERFHFGNSLGIVASDLMSSESCRIVLESSLDDSLKVRLLKLLAKATEEVVYGWYIQFLMDYLPLSSDAITIDRITDSINWVTGTYTIKFPIYFGYTLAGVDVPEGFDQLALDLGLLFQTGDDVIGLMGDSDVTGKSNTGDIAQGKKTLPMFFCYQGASPEDRKQLELLVGKKDITSQELSIVRDIIARSRGLDKSRTLMREYRDACLSTIDSMDIPPDLKRFLRGFTLYLEHRDF